jgi:hypothetical protein
MITPMIFDERNNTIRTDHHSLLSIFTKSFNKFQFYIPAHPVMLRFLTFHAVNLILTPDAYDRRQLWVHLITILAVKALKISETRCHPITHFLKDILTYKLLNNDWMDDWVATIRRTLEIINCFGLFIYNADQIILKARTTKEMFAAINIYNILNLDLSIIERTD